MEQWFAALGDDMPDLGDEDIAGALADFPLKDFLAGSPPRETVSDGFQQHDASHGVSSEPTSSAEGPLDGSAGGQGGTSGLSRGLGAFRSFSTNDLQLLQSLDSPQYALPSFGLSAPQPSGGNHLLSRPGSKPVKQAPGLASVPEGGPPQEAATPQPDMLAATPNSAAVCGAEPVAAAQPGHTGGPSSGPATFLPSSGLCPSHTPPFAPAFTGGNCNSETVPADPAAATAVAGSPPMPTSMPPAGFGMRHVMSCGSLSTLMNNTLQIKKEESDESAGTALGAQPGHPGGLVLPAGVPPTVPAPTPSSAAAAAGAAAAAAAGVTPGHPGYNNAVAAAAAAAAAAVAAGMYPGGQPMQPMQAYHAATMPGSVPPLYGMQPPVYQMGMPMMPQLPHLSMAQLPAAQPSATVTGALAAKPDHAAAASEPTTSDGGQKPTTAGAADATPFQGGAGTAPPETGPVEGGGGFGPRLRKVHSALELGAWRQLAESESVEPGLGQVAEAPAAKMIGRLTAEERLQRILRYRAKRDKRNFNREIKYQCRKTLADSRPRVGGRFARNDDPNSVLPHQTKKAQRSKQQPQASAQQQSMQQQLQQQQQQQAQAQNRKGAASGGASPMPPPAAHNAAAAAAAAAAVQNQNRMSAASARNAAAAAAAAAAVAAAQAQAAALVMGTHNGGGSALGLGPGAGFQPQAARAPDTTPQPGAGQVGAQHAGGPAAPGAASGAAAAAPGDVDMHTAAGEQQQAAAAPLQQQSGSGTAPASLQQRTSSSTTTTTHSTTTSSENHTASSAGTAAAAMAAAAAAAVAAAAAAMGNPSSASCAPAPGQPQPPSQPVFLPPPGISPIPPGAAPPGQPPVALPAQYMPHGIALPYPYGIPLVQYGGATLVAPPGAAVQLPPTLPAQQHQHLQQLQHQYAAAAQAAANTLYAHLGAPPGTVLAFAPPGSSPTPQLTAMPPPAAPAPAPGAPVSHVLHHPSAAYPAAAPVQLPYGMPQHVAAPPASMPVPVMQQPQAQVQPQQGLELQAHTPDSGAAMQAPCGDDLVAALVDAGDMAPRLDSPLIDALFSHMDAEMHTTVCGGGGEGELGAACMDAGGGQAAADAFLQSIVAGGGSTAMAVDG